ncbi:MAG: prenyltransferase/squalene oxidase repeat-containing protein [Bryobacteraceae bacterium]
MSSRRDFLRQTQNADGGWGYFPGKRSWLEPTLYATLALHGDAAASKSFALIQSWAVPTGGWRMSDDVPEVNWTSALCLTAYMARNVRDQAFDRGLQRVLRTVGAEGSFTMDLTQFLNPGLVEFDNRVQGWPWRLDNASWVEPTVHSLVALKNAAKLPGESRNLLSMRARIRSAERMLMNRRCEDGGWNYGNSRVWSTALPSYPETTGIALLGLQEASQTDLQPSLAIAEKYWHETQSPLGKAWLTIALRNFGAHIEAPPATQTVKPSQDILVAALQCLGEPNGGHHFLKTAET